MASAGVAYVTVAGNFAPFEKQLAGLASGRVGTQMTAVGKSLTKNLTLPILAIGAAAGKLSMDFQRSMTLISTQAGGTHKEVKKLGDQILKLSEKGRFAQGPNELAQALFHIESVGYRGAKAMKVLKSSSDLATIGNAELEATTNALVSAMKTGIKGTGNMREAIGTMNATIGAGNLRMEDLTSAMGTGFLSSAKAFGLSLQGILAPLAELTAEGVPATQAATRLRMTMSLMAAPTEKAQEALASIGIGSEDMAKKMRSSGGLNSALEELQSHLSKLSKVQQAQLLAGAFGGAKSGSTILALLGNLDSLNKKYVEIGKNAGDVNEKLKEANKDAAVKLERTWSKIQASLIKIGDQLLPLIAPLVQEIGDDVVNVVHAFTDLPKATKEWIVKIALVAAALGPVLTIGGKLFRLFSGVATVISTIAKGIGLIGTESAVSGAAGAAGAAGGAGAAGAGATVARWLGTDAAPAAAGSAGMFGEKAALAGSGLFGGAAAGGMGAAVSTAAMTLGGVAGGYFAAEFGAKAIEGITGADLLENQNLAKSLTHGFNTSHVAATEAGALAEAAAKEKGIHPQLGEHSKVLKELQASFKETMASISVAGISGLNSVNNNLTVGLEEADAIWSKGTKPWRQHTAEAMQASVKAIRSGIQDGTINAETGQKEISRLLNQIHITKGNDPFGLAQATTKSFKEANGITASGVKTWAAKLEQMPAAARRSSIDSTNKMLEAWAQGHPKIEQQIKSLTAFEVTHFGATNKQLREGVRSGATGPVAEAFQEAAIGVGGALNNIGTNTSAMLKALGLNSMVQFQALVLGPARTGATTGSKASTNPHGHQHGPAFHQRGGFVVPGAGEGDSFATVLPPESFVLNKKATRAFGFQGGGHVPVVLEPQERVFMPPEVAAIGRPTLEAANAAVPRGLATGGSVKVSGPGVLASIGHGALAKAVEASNRFLKAHMPKASPKTGPLGTGSASGVEQLAQIVMKQFPGLVITSGYRPGDPGYHGLNEARDLGSGSYPLMNRAAAWVGSHYGRSLTEGIHNPNLSIKYGHDVPDSYWGEPTWSEHLNHIHLAIAGRATAGLAKGGPIQKFAGGGVVKEVGEILLRNKLDSVSAAGILGNAYGESSWNPSSVGTGGDGLWGFTASPVSPADLAAYAASQGKPWDDAAVQTQFMLHNLPTSLRDQMNAMSSVADTTSAFMHGWERPENYSSLPTRIEYGEKALRILGGAGTSSGGSTGSGSTTAPQVKAEVPFATKGGATSAAGGTYAPGKGKVKTAKISFGSLPKTLPEVRKELAQRRLELEQYKLALHGVKDKETKQALEVNISLLRNRIHALLSQQIRLMAAAKRKQVSAHIEARGVFPQIEALIGQKESAYNAASELAEQIVALEPEEAPQAIPYIEGRETPAWADVLSSEAGWRNAVLQGEEVAGMRLRSLEAQVESINALRTTNPKAWRKRKYKIPALQKAIAAVKGVFTPMHADSMKDLMAGRVTGATGTFEEGLVNLQGINHSRVPMAELPSAPVAGNFGGLIWDTQMSIRELGLKIKQLNESSTPEKNGEREALLEELLRQANQRLLIRGVEQKTFGEFPPFAGTAHVGAIVPGPAGAERTMVVKGGEGIFTEDQRDWLGGAIGSGSASDVKVHVHGDIVSSHPDPIEVLIGDRRVEAEIRRVTSQDQRRASRVAGRGLARAGR